MQMKEVVSVNGQKVLKALPSSLVVDTSLSSTSSNPVQNKVVTEALNELKNDFYLVTTTVPSSATSVDMLTLPEGFSDACVISKEVSQGSGWQSTNDFIYVVNGRQFKGGWSGNSYWYGKPIRILFKKNN